MSININISNISFSKFFTFIAVLITAITVFTYSSSLDNNFTNWDDSAILVNNVLTHNLSLKNLKSIFIIGKNTRLTLSEYIPITIVSFTIENHFGGLNPRTYHTTNLVLHIVNSLLIFLFIYTISRKKWIAFWVSVFWAVHTLNVESVCWITGRKDVLCAFFYLLSILTYAISLQKKKKKIKRLTFIFFIFALLSKPSAVSLPLILILYDYLYNGKITLQSFLKKWLYFTASIAFTLIAIHGQNSTAPIPPVNFASIYQNCLIACRGLTFYICKGFLPVNLSAVYPRTLTLSFFDPHYFFPVLVVIIFFCTIYLCHKKFKYITFGLIFFIIALLPVLQFLPVGVPIYAADRFFYIPSIGFLFAIIIAFSHIIKNNKQLNHIAAIVAIGFIILLIGVTRSRSMIWQNSEILWKNVIMRSPNFGFAHNSLASYYYDNNLFSKAKKYLNKSISLAPDMPFPYHLLGSIALTENNVSQAIYYAEKEISVAPYYQNGYFLLGECNARLSNKIKTFNCYDKGFKINPYDIKTRKKFSEICLAFGETNKAIQHLEYISSLEPKNIFVHGHLAILSENVKNYILAEKHYNFLTKALTDYHINWYKLGVCQQKNGKTNDALVSYANLLKYYPKHDATWNNLALILKAQNDLNKAEKYIEIAAEINPKSDSILYNYACIATLNKNTNTAIQKLKKAIEINPELKNKARKNKDFTILKNNPKFNKIIF